MAERILQVPDELLRIQKIREKLSGTDREDHLESVDEWERKAKKALIFLNLKGHEGITMLLEKADEEIAAINEKLLENTRPIDRFNPESLIEKALLRERYLDQRALWHWFKGLFEEAESDLNDVKESLHEEENAPEGE